MPEGTCFLEDRKFARRIASTAILAWRRSETCQMLESPDSASYVVRCDLASVQALLFLGWKSSAILACKSGTLIGVIAPMGVGG